MLGAQPDHGLQQRRAVDAEEHRLGHGVARLLIAFPPGRDPGRGDLLEREQRIVGGDRLARRAHRLGQGLDRLHHRVLVGEHGEAQAVGMHLPHHLGRLLGRHRPHHRLDERAVEAVVDLRHAGDRGEALVVLVAVGAERADVVQAARLQAEEILAVDQVAMLGGLVDLVDHRLVEAGRHQVDHVHAGGEFGMFLGRHLARDEDAEMADRLVQGVDDGLAVGDDLVLVVVEIGDPAQRLLRRRDVVAPRAEAR